MPDTQPAGACPALTPPPPRRYQAMPATTAYTLPTIHLNGTGARSLAAEYHEVYKAVNRACEALAAATCNARDFYPQGDGAYQQAHKERAEALQKLKEVQDLAEAWMARASGDI